MNLITLGALIASALLHVSDSDDTIQLVSSNIDDVLNRHELVLINFYADWCRFSQMLAPVFSETAKQVKKEFPEEGKIAFGKVDCDRETQISTKYHVNKYPTLKMFRNGNLAKKEYRGQRSPEAMGNFLREQLKSPINVLASAEDVDSLDDKKRHLVFFVDSETSPDYPHFSKLASTLRDDCRFHVLQGDAIREDRLLGNKIVFRTGGIQSPEEAYEGSIQDAESLTTWAKEKCVPLVREITFENAEELTEEGLPFLILFHKPDDHDTPANFRKAVASQLMGERTAVNFLTADGLKFTHPLYHLGKSAQDLPVLAIDSFRHMYLWKHNPKTQLTEENLLKNFVADLHSGKLHREFHHGPDPTPQPPAQIADKSSHPANGRHFDVQQQIILKNQGGNVQVMKVIKIGPHVGPHQAGHISKKINEIEKDLNKESEKLVQEAVKLEAKKQEDNDDDNNDNNDDDDDDDDTELIDEAGDGNDNDDEDNTDDEEDNDDDDEDGDDENHDIDNDLPEVKEDKIKLPSEKLLAPESNFVKTLKTDSTTKILELRTKVNVHDPSAEAAPSVKSRSPPESVFKNLAPSRNRYTILKDEL